VIELAEIFLHEVYKAVRVVVFGRLHVLSVVWHGRSSDVDTVEEAELAIRFFLGGLVRKTSAEFCF
jgi:hypothetical protein